MKKIFLCLSALAFAAIGFAQETITLKYSENGDAGYGDAGGILTPWVTFLPETLDIYSGSVIKSIKIETGAKANNVSIYIKHKPEDETALLTQKVGTLNAGVHEIALDAPFTLVEGDTISLGYKATFTKADGALYGKPKNELACKAYYNTKSKWIDVNGSFCIAAILSGDALPMNEAAAVSLKNTVVAPGATSGFMPFTILNYGAKDITDITYSYTVDGGDKTMVDYTFETPVVNAATGELTVEVPSPGIGRHDIVVEIEKVNGEEDTYKINNKVEGVLTQKDEWFIRRVVCEEVTGTWCSWCPRGIVGMEMMEENHPGEFISVAVHNADVFSCAGFDPLMAQITSLPGCVVDRSQSGDPYYDIEKMFARDKEADTFVGIRIKPYYTYYDGKVTLTNTLRVDKEVDGNTLNIGYIVLEDNLVGQQYNAYSGGGQGEMGGWEDLPDLVVPYIYKDIARASVPEYGGINLVDGKTLVPGEDYEFEYTFTLPENVADAKNVKIVALVLDKGNGYVLNADRAQLDGEFSAVSSMENDGAEVIKTEIYSLDGVLLDSVEGKWNGNSIDGRIVVIREITAEGAVVRKQIN